jgi:hypothetical protein
MNKIKITDYRKDIDGLRAIAVYFSKILNISLSEKNSIYK